MTTKIYLANKDITWLDQNVTSCLRAEGREGGQNLLMGSSTQLEVMAVGWREFWGLDGCEGASGAQSWVPKVMKLAVDGVTEGWDSLYWYESWQQQRRELI